MKFLPITFTVALFFCSIHSFGEDLKQTFKEIYQEGTGSRYNLDLEDRGRADVSIYVAKSEGNQLDVEMYFKHQGLELTEMWQLFQIEKNGEGIPLDIKKGIFFVKELDGPEIMPDDLLKGDDGVMLSDFLISKSSDLDKYKIGNEKITVPAGTIDVVHYKKSYKDKDIEFFIAEEVKPFGIVKLISKSKQDNPEKNYVMSLTSLLKGVKPHINPEKASSLSTKGKKLLKRPS